MVELKSIDQLLYFMKNHIHLSRYDEKFIENISTLSNVTTNQVILLHRLIFKYRRQFIKHEMFVEKLVELPWNVNVVESSPQYTEGHVSIVDDIIYFRCPFNRNFIDEFRKIPLNMFVWNKQKRHYEALYNVYSLKILLKTAEKFFPKVHLYEDTQKMLNELKPFEPMLYWQPTLIERNNNLFIAATNSSLEAALGDLKLSANENTYLTLSKHGVTIGAEFYENDERLEFMCKYNPCIEQTDIHKLVNWLKDIKCDMVYLFGLSSVNLIKRKITESLVEADIPHIDLNYQVQPVDIVYNCPVLLKPKKNFDAGNDAMRVTKAITVVNSTPIDIK